MDSKEMIPVEVFCMHHNVEVSFIISLHEYSLIEIVKEDKGQYIPASQLTEAEKIIRLHNDLNINTEGIDVVLHLLQKIKAMQQEIVSLKGRLKITDNDYGNLY